MLNEKYEDCHYLNKVTDGELQNSIFFSSSTPSNERQILNLASALNQNAAVRRSYVDTHLAQKLDESIQQDLDMGGKKIFNMAQGTKNDDAVNALQLQQKADNIRQSKLFK